MQHLTCTKIRHRETKHDIVIPIPAGASEFVKHDVIHCLVKYYDRPAIDMLKMDQSNAQIAQEIFESKPIEFRRNCVREEVMTIAIEKYERTSCFCTYFKQGSLFPNLLNVIQFLVKLLMTLLWSLSVQH